MGFGVFQSANYGEAATMVAVGVLGMWVLDTYLSWYDSFLAYHYLMERSFWFCK